MSLSSVCGALGLGQMMPLLFYRGTIGAPRESSRTYSRNFPPPEIDPPRMCGEASGHV